MAFILNTAGLAAPITIDRDANYSACFNFGSMVNGGTVSPHWLADGHSFWFTLGAPENREVLLADPISGSIQPMFDVKALRAEIKNITGEDPPGHGIPFATFTLDEEKSIASFSISERNFELDRKLGKLTELIENGSSSSDPEPSDPQLAQVIPNPAGDRVALMRDENLWLMDADGANEIQVTFNGDKDHAWFPSEFSWAPNGKHLVVQCFDLTPAPTIPIVDWLDPAAPTERQTYTQCREPRYLAETHIVDAKSGNIKELECRLDPEDGCQHMGWTPETEEILIIRFDRSLKRMDLLAADPSSGKIRTIVAEKSDTFIDGLGISWMLPAYITDVGDDQHFIWISERDGFHHLYLYNYDGELKRQLTTGNFPIVKILDIDQENGFVYLMARSDTSDLTSRHLCRVKLDGSDFQQLTSATGRRQIHLSPDFSCFVDNHSDIDRPPLAELRQIDGDLIAELATADISALQEIQWQAPERVIAKGADGKSNCYCAIYLPPGFDPARKYPVIEVIYAGPQWMIVPRRFVAGEYGDTASALAQLGYVSVIIDSPGTADVGKDYQDAVYGKLGQIEIPDHVAAMRDLEKTRPWMDLERVGVHGKSWGGYFTLRAMLQAPEFYKVGVASAAMADLATTAESPIVPYLGLFADNPDAYAAADCLTMAGNLEGNLLITTGSSDANTPFGQTMRMIKAFNDADKDVDILVLPGENHWLQGAAHRRWQRAMRDHFLRWLPVEQVSE